MNTLDASTAANLRAALARSQMTANDLAEQLGVSDMWVSRRLNGKLSPTVAELARIAHVLGVRPADLLGEDAA